MLLDIFDSCEGFMGIKSRYDIRGWLEGAEAGNRKKNMHS